MTEFKIIKRCLFLNLKKVNIKILDIKKELLENIKLVNFKKSFFNNSHNGIVNFTSFVHFTI